MMKSVLLFVVGVVLCGGFSFDQNLLPPSTVDSLETAAYKGRWFVMYSSLIPTTTYLQGGFCVLADHTYFKTEDGKSTYNVLYSSR
jgi:hypothetical protein